MNESNPISMKMKAVSTLTRAVQRVSNDSTPKTILHGAMKPELMSPACHRAQLDP